MSCNCRSYNWEIGEVPERILGYPFTGNTVCIDACIAHVLEHLWENGIETLGSCCGHGKDSPSIVLSQDNAERVRRLIADVDNRQFKLLFWRLVEV